MNNSQTMLDLKTWAVIGATAKPEKYGYKIFEFLQQAGTYTVYPVNPGLTEVLGRRCFPSVKDLPVRPDVVNIVVPPAVAGQVLRECAAAGIRNVWLQPGADTPAVVALAAELGLAVVADCVICATDARTGATTPH